MHHRFLATGAAVALAIALSGAALATSANAEPETQNHGHGVTANWTLTWGGDNPFTVDWYRGDNTGIFWPSTNAVNFNDSHAFWPCFNTQFTQKLRVWDSDSGYAQDYTKATESGGSPC
jgi:hypothetical protein